MDQSPRCPACNRAFQNVFDYPTVRVLAFEPLPIPEAVDEMSAAAAEKRLARERHLPRHPAEYRPGGINMTPAIERACNTKIVEDYFGHLAALLGREVLPQGLTPPLPADPFFRHAHPVPGTGIYLSLEDSGVNDGRERRAEIAVYCEGPNLGSAGGPTLQRLGAIGLLTYEGLLVEKFRSSGEHNA